MPATTELEAAAEHGLLSKIVDESVFTRTLERFKANGLSLPTFAQLADPTLAPASARAGLAGVSPSEPHAANLWRVHWYNGEGGKDVVAVPGYVELPPELTGVDARIVLAFGNRFPMIGAHKVLAAYACLVPRIVTGQFDPTWSRAVWPSTGNYARGGVAISRIMGCRGVAVLPTGMSQERFDWLDRWIGHSDDVIRTPGTESNVKEIYDKCAELRTDPQNVILNQFCEFGNHLAHYHVTGSALGRVFEDVAASLGGRGRLAGFVSASGSAGTLAAGDYLKDTYGARIVAVEALECPTMLENGFGEHNIQGIGDKHIPLIHNVMNTDFVAGISDLSTDTLDVLFNTDAGRTYLVERIGVAPEVVAELPNLGLSSICNALAAIKLAKHLGLGREDVILTVATDGSEMYGSERAGVLAETYPEGFGAADAARAFGEHLGAVDTSAFEELGEVGRRRVFNLGYYTWVEQQGISVHDFELRRSQDFWRSIRSFLPEWDAAIDDFNARTGMLADA